MPDSPPCRDDQHASVRREIGEKGSAKHQRQAESRILDASLDGQGAAVLIGQTCCRSYSETDAKRQQIMDQDHDEDVLDALQEGGHVAAEGEHDHRHEENDGGPLQRLFQLFGDLRQEL